MTIISVDSPSVDPKSKPENPSNSTLTACSQEHTHHISPLSFPGADGQSGPQGSICFPVDPGDWTSVSTGLEKRTSRKHKGLFKSKYLEMCPLLGLQRPPSHTGLLSPGFSFRIGKASLCLLICLGSRFLL